MKDKFADISLENKQKHFNQIQELRERLKKEPVLKQLFFEMTLKCNEHCLHCGSHAGECTEEKDRITDLEIYSTLVELRDDLRKNKKPLPFIAITGGEPLLRPGVIDLMKKIHKLGYSWGMTSNGVLITEDVAKQLREAGMYSIGLSLDGLEESHNWFRQTKTGYKKVLEAFENLKNAGQKNVMLTTVINKRNISELDELYKLMKSIECKTWRIINMEPIGRALDNKDLMLDKEDYQTMIKFIVDHQDDPDMSIIGSCNHYLGLDLERKTRTWYFQCLAGVGIASVTYNGNITACLDIERRDYLVFGNIRKDSLYDTWINEFKPFRSESKTVESSKCKECKHKDNCDGGGWHTWNFEEHNPRICMLEKLDRL